MAQEVGPDYGNWVSPRFVYGPAGVGVIFAASGVVWRPLVFPAALCLLVAGYFAYARYRFSPRGGNIQTKVRDLLLERLEWGGQGQVLDIGCGNALLTVEIARRYPRAQVTGVDFWGANWAYSQRLCEQNAKAAGVAEQVSFRKASAAALPYADGQFDAVVSNLCFHEVRDVADKREVVREALRVLRKGGRFAFQDLFLLERAYGDTDGLVATLGSWGVSKVEFVRTCDAPFIPKALKLPFMLGTMGVLYGEK